MRLVGDELLLLVDRPPGRVRHRVVLRRELLGLQLGAHPVLGDHGAADLVHLLQVVRRPGGDLAEDEMLGDPPAEEHDEVVHQLLLGLQVAVLLRQVEGVAECAAARDDRNAVHLLDAGEELGADGVPGLVVGHDPLLVIGDHAARLHAGDDPLERRLEVLGGDLLALRPAGEDRSLVADVGQVGARQAAGLAGDQVELYVAGQRFVARVDLDDRLATLEVGGRDEDLAVEAPRAHQRGVELVDQVGRGDHDHLVAGFEAVELYEQLIQRLVLLAGDVRAARGADRVELVDEHDRRRVLARLAEQPPDASRAEPHEHLDEAGRRLREEPGAGLVGHGLGEQRLAGARRAVQQDALRDLRPQAAEAHRVAEELHDLPQLVLGLVGPGHVLPANGARGLRLDLLRLGANGQLPEQQDHHYGDERHEDDGQPNDGPILETLH